MTRRKRSGALGRIEQKMPDDTSGLQTERFQPELRGLEGWAHGVGYGPVGQTDEAGSA